MKEKGGKKRKFILLLGKGKIKKKKEKRKMKKEKRKKDKQQYRNDLNFRGLLMKNSNDTDTDVPNYQKSYSENLRMLEDSLFKA